MKKDNSAKSLPVKASKYPTKRTVNLPSGNPTPAAP